MITSLTWQSGRWTVALALLAVPIHYDALPRSAEPSSPPQIAAYQSAIDVVEIHPPVARKIKCSEHPLGQEDHAGDALAQDCSVVRDNGGSRERFPSFYSDEGLRNEDWFSWNEPLLAPFDGVVRGIHLNPVTNEPGVRGRGMASVLMFERIHAGDDRPIQVGYVHVQDVQVQIGDTVKVGEVVAHIGNNGISDYPHVHIGAVRGDLIALMSGVGKPEDIEPLQIRFDLAAMGRLRGYTR
jgi:hypothetical protein